MCIPLWFKNDFDAQQVIVAVMYHHRWFRNFPKPSEDGYKILSRAIGHLAKRIDEEQEKHKDCV